MQDTAYKGLNTSVSVYQTHFLARSDYDAMLRTNSLSEVLNVIKKTDYHIPENVEYSKDFDGFLMLNLQDVYNKMYEQTPENRVIDLSALRYEYHNLKVLFKEWYTESDFSKMYINIGRHGIEELRKQVRAEDDSNSIHPIMRKAISDVKIYFDEYHNYDGISIILDSAYLTHLRAIANEINDKKLSQYVDMKIDFSNLLIMARGINQNRSRGTLKAILSDYGTIETEVLLDLGRNKDMARIIELYTFLPFGDNLKNALSEKSDGKINVTDLEHKVNEIEAEEMRELALIAFGPMPILSYLYFKENEISNLRLLLVGKANDLSDVKIEERMRPIYGS